MLAVFVLGCATCMSELLRCGLMAFVWQSCWFGISNCYSEDVQGCSRLHRLMFLSFWRIYQIMAGVISGLVIGYASFTRIMNFSLKLLSHLAWYLFCYYNSQTFSPHSTTLRMRERLPPRRSLRRRLLPRRLLWSLPKLLNVRKFILIIYYIRFC